MKLIRKISIGQDYKNEAMHYSVGQEVMAGILFAIYSQKKMVRIKYTLLRIKKFCLGNILMVTWQYQLNTI